MADSKRRGRSVLRLIVAAGLTIAALDLPGQALAADTPPAWRQ